MQSNGKALTGHLLALSSVVVWGSTFIFSKILLEAFSPLQVMVMRFVIAFIVLWCFLGNRLFFYLFRPLEMILISDRHSDRDMQQKLAEIEAYYAEKYPPEVPALEVEPQNPELVDFEKELARIAKEKANAEKQLMGIENKLKNEGFLAKAPEAVINGAKEDAAKLRALIEKLTESEKAMKK